MADMPKDDTPVKPRPLAEGQSAFDWDVRGVKTHKEDLSDPDQARYDAINKVGQFLVDFNSFPQELLVSEGELSLMLGASAEAPVPEVTILMPREIQKSITEARKHRTNK